MFNRSSLGEVDEFMGAVLRGTLALGIHIIFISTIFMLAGNILDDFGHGSLYYLTVLNGCLWGLYFFLDRGKKQAIPENQLNDTIEKTYSELKFLTISVVLINVTFIFLSFLPLLVIEFDVVNFSWPLSEIGNWFYLFEGIFLCGLSYIIHSRRRTLRIEHTPCPTCSHPLKYIREDQKYYCENCRKYFKRKNKRKNEGMNEKEEEVNE